MRCYVTLSSVFLIMRQKRVVLLLSATAIKYVILLFMFNTVYYGYLSRSFVDFVDFLSMVIQVIFLCTQCLRYNICSAWFLDIRISTCY